MVRESEIRDGELAVDMPAARDAGLVFIGRIRTPWTSRLATPRQGRHDGPVCRLEIFEPWVPAIKGVDFYSNLEVIYWLHQSRRDLVLQSPKNNKSTRGTFSRAMWCWSGALTASTKRRCSISSPTAANSPRWRRRSQAISRRNRRPTCPSTPQSISPCYLPTPWCLPCDSPAAAVRCRPGAASHGHAGEILPVRRQLR